MLFSGHACRSSEEQAPKIAFANTREAGDILPAARSDRASDHRRTVVAGPDSARWDNGAAQMGTAPF